jgi:predicted hotdog family 3-hydroxylacyl-ACP dehydratase
MKRDGILALIPHAGSICLLDEVLDWDSEKISCLSHCFAGVENPLRRPDGTLGTASGIEIAAQAMAVHGRLTAPAAGAAIPGYLVSLRDIHLAVPNLDTPGPLTITATRLLGDARGATYSFSVTNAQTELVTGRATVLFGVTS